MSRNSRPRSRGSVPVVLVFGESRNDTQAVKCLIEALCPELTGRVLARPQPTSLQRGASASSVRKWTTKVADVARNNERPVVCVFVHRDADGHDPLGKIQRYTETNLRNAGTPGAHAVVPVQEMEAWWLLFPDATEQLRPSKWKGTLQRSSRNVDAIANPKEELTERTGRNSRKHAYSEADSPRVAEKVAAAIVEGMAPSGQSRSFNRFVSSVSECCKNTSSDR